MELTQVNKSTEVKADSITSAHLAQQLAERDQVLTHRLSEQLAERDQTSAQQFSRMLEQFTSLQRNFDQFKQAALQSIGTTSSATSHSGTRVSQSSTETLPEHDTLAVSTSGTHDGLIAIDNESDLDSDTISSVSSVSAMQDSANKSDIDIYACASTLSSTDATPAVAPTDVSLERAHMHSPAPVAGAVVPHPWIATLTEDGETYYHNTETDETSWDLPSA